MHTDQYIQPISISTTILQLEPIQIMIENTHSQRQDSHAHKTNDLYR